VSWRTSPESEAPDASYVGWAPVPPPNYTPAPGYYPQDYSGGGAPYGGPVDNLISSPFWIFVRGASFLLGLNSPYTPSYSYWGCGALLPPAYVPYYFNRTVIVNNYYTPGYYPAGYIGGVGVYNWGPPLPYVARVTRFNQAAINTYLQQANIYQRRNVMPPPALLTRYPHFREVLPPAVLSREPLPLGARFQGARVARANLVQPHLLNAGLIRNTPAISGSIPRARMTEGGPWRRGVPGAALPASAMIRPDRQMEEHLRNIPATQRLEPVSPSARKWTAPTTPGAAMVAPGPAPHHRNSELSSATPWTSGTQPAPVPHRHASRGTPQYITPGQPVASQETMGPQRRMPPTGAVSHGTAEPTQAVAPRERYRPRESQPGPWGKHEQAPQASVSPGQYPRQRQNYCPPGTPSASRANTPQNQPARPPWAQPSQPRQQQPTVQPPAQMHRQPPPQPQQVQRAPQAQPQPQVHQQSQRQPQPQHQPQSQGQSRSQGSQKQQGKHNQQNQ